MRFGQMRIVHQFGETLTAEHNNPHIFLPVYYDYAHFQLFLKQNSLIFFLVNDSVSLPYRANSILK